MAGRYTTFQANQMERLWYQGAKSKYKVSLQNCFHKLKYILSYL